MRRTARTVVAAVLGATLLVGILGSGASAQEATRNPFGLLLPRMQEDVGDLAVGMGASVARPQQVWIESDGTLEGDDICEQCPEYRAKGLDVVLTVRNANVPNESPWISTSAPPTDLEAYKAKLRTIIEEAQPDVIAVENEETGEDQFVGTPEQYIAELTAACEVAHEMGILCTNGGLTGGKVVRMTYMNYWDSGRQAEALDFAARVTASSEEYAYMMDPSKVNWVRNAADHGRLFADNYKAAGADFLNFHWYETDTQAFEEVVTYLESFGLPVITNEIGQRDLDTANIVGHMQKVLDLDLRYAIWFSLDKVTNSPETSVVALQNRDETLRPHGEAYREFVTLNASPSGSRWASLTASSEKISTGTKVNLSGRLMGPAGCVANQTVQLRIWKWNETSFRVVASGQTDATGAYAAPIKLKDQGKKLQIFAPASPCGLAAEGLIVTVMPL